MIEAAVTIIFNKDNKALLLKRMSPQKEFEGLWGLPGGAVEGGETYKDCAIREAKEEASLNISNLKYVGTDRGFVWIYTTRTYCGNIKLNFEHTDFAWVSIAELPNYNTIPGTFGLIKEASIL